MVFFFNISENLQENQNTKVVFWKDCEFSLNVPVFTGINFLAWSFYQKFSLFGINRKKPILNI